MDRKTKEQIVRSLQQKVGKGNIDLPDRIGFDGNERELKMILPEGAAHGNMQDDNSAFEGWAAILKALYMKDTGVIELDVDDKLSDFKAGEGLGDYGRFLYRAMRLRECNGFRLSERIGSVVEAFETYLKNNSFRNNYPKGDIKESSGETRVERSVERYFASESGSTVLWKLLEREGFRPGGVDIFRQLPVGLFQGGNAADVKKEKTVFTGGGAAVDLWTISGDTLLPFELKADDNKKVGAITELFFYANYLYDMFVNPLPGFQSAKKPRSRGYQNLVSPPERLKQVKGYLLVEQLHPLFRQDVLAVLERPQGRRISYGILPYQLGANGKSGR